MTDTTKPALPEPLWAAVERYADEVAEYNAALRIDVGVDAAGKSCLAAEVEARDAIRAAIDAAVAEARAVPGGWADQVEQRLLTWQQRKMNRSGDRLALNDFMGQDSIDDLIDFVCAPLDCGEAGHAEGRCGNASCITPAQGEQP